MNHTATRRIYKFARAYGYRYARDNPKVSRQQLTQAMLDYLSSIGPWDVPEPVLEYQAKEATGHVLFIVSQGKLDEAINSPQGRFPEQGPS